MSNLTIFTNEQFGEIRTTVIDGEPWFVGKDVAVALGYKNPKVALQDNVEETDKGVTKVTTPGGKQDATIINESGLYCLVFGSRLETAKAFRHWITSEVIPSIRKTGSYGTPQTVRMSDALAAMANVARLAEDNQRRLDAIETSAKELDSKLTGVVDTLTAPTADSDVWQTETRKTVTKLIRDNKLSYQAYWADLYERLELRAGVNLETRQKRMKERLAKQGVAKHVINNVSKLLVISQDKKLVDIFNSIVREEKAKYVLMKGGCTA